VNDRKSIFSVSPRQGRVLFVLGDVVTLRLSGAETGGAFSMVESISAPGGGAAFLHAHDQQETFCIQEGDFELYGQDENGDKYTIPASSGATVHVPGNVAHGFRNVGDTPGRILTVFEPAGGMIDFFEELGVPMESVSDPLPFDKMPSPQRIEEALKKYNIQMLETPGVD